MFDLGLLLRPIEQIVPQPLVGGTSAVIPDLDSTQGRALLGSLAAVSNQAIIGEAGDAIADSLAHESDRLLKILDAGHEVDGLSQDAQDVVQAAIRDLTSIAADCFQELSAIAPTVAMNPAAAGGTLLPIAARHWQRAETRYQAMELELSDLTRRVNQVSIPDDHAHVQPSAVQVHEADVSPTPHGSGRAQQAVDAAKTALGTPYQWGGTTPGQGLDCSGLTQWAYAQAGIELPRTAEAQAIGPQISRNDVQPGDLAVWDGHVAMIVNDSEMIEAGDPVQINPIRQDNIGMAFRGFYRPTAAE